MAPTVESFGLYFAGRWLQRDKPLAEYVGTNEKSKALIRLCALSPAASGDATYAGASAAPVAVAAPHSEVLELPLHEPAQPRKFARASANGSHSGPYSVSLSAFFKKNDFARSSEEAYFDAEEPDDDQTMLSEAQLSRLHASPLVRTGLSSKHLRDLIRHIDGDSSRELALRRLELALADEEFTQFTRDLLVDIGHTSA